jgi:hypothetical protein
MLSFRGDARFPCVATNRGHVGSVPSECPGRQRDSTEDVKDAVHYSEANTFATTFRARYGEGQPSVI